jgi:hypothetical protein
MMTKIGVLIVSKGVVLGVEDMSYVGLTNGNCLERFVEKRIVPNGMSD